jgi:hypothetical protein
MNVNEIEKSLCKLYRKGCNNQKIDVGYQTEKQIIYRRIKNLERQYKPLDMPALCEKHGI